MAVKRSVLRLCVMASLVGIISCGGTADEPTAVPATGEPTNAAATIVPTAEIPTATPAAPATPTDRVVTPTDTPRPRARIFFEWAPGSHGIIDPDAVVYEILPSLNERRDGVIDGYGDENGITIQYDPTVITVEEIMADFERIGYPVANPND